MRAAAPWIAAGVGVVLLAVNLLLLVSTRAEVAALRRELRRGPEGARGLVSEPSRAEAPAAPRQEARIESSALEEEARAFYKAQLEAVASGRPETAAANIEAAAGRYDATSYGVKIRSLAYKVDAIDAGAAPDGF